MSLLLIESPSTRLIVTDDCISSTDDDDDADDADDVDDVDDSRRHWR